jgi:hypothetical protein
MMTWLHVAMVEPGQVSPHRQEVVTTAARPGPRGDFKEPKKARASGSCKGSSPTPRSPRLWSTRPSRSRARTSPAPTSTWTQPSSPASSLRTSTRNSPGSWPRPASAGRGGFHGEGRAVRLPARRDDHDRDRVLPPGHAVPPQGSRRPHPYRHRRRSGLRRGGDHCRGSAGGSALRDAWAMPGLEEGSAQRFLMILLR